MGCVAETTPGCGIWLPDGKSDPFIVALLRSIGRATTLEAWAELDDQRSTRPVTIYTTEEIMGFNPGQSCELCGSQCQSSSSLFCYRCPVEREGDCKKFVAKMTRRAKKMEGVDG